MEPFNKALGPTSNHMMLQTDTPDCALHCVQTRSKLVCIGSMCCPSRSFTIISKAGFSTSCWSHSAG